MKSAINSLKKKKNIPDISKSFHVQWSKEMWSDEKTSVNTSRDTPL
jgi:hypothetical protein